MATDNNLEINKDLNSNKAQDKYRTYETREGEKVDIVNNVRNENEKNKGLINQQTNAVDAKKQELQTNYDKEESVPGPVKAATGAVGAVVSNVAKTAGAVGEDELKNDLLKAKNKGSNMLYDTFSNNKESSNLTTQNTEAKPKENLSIGNNTSNANTNNTKSLTLSNEPRDNQNISQNTSTEQSVVNNATTFKEGNNQDFVDITANKPKSLSPKTYAEESADEENMQLASKNDISSESTVIKNELSSSQFSTNNAIRNNDTTKLNEQTGAGELASQVSTSVSQDYRGAVNNIANNTLKTNDVNFSPNQSSVPSLNEPNESTGNTLQNTGPNDASKISEPESSSIPEIKTESLLEENLSKERPKVVTKVVEKENKSNQQAEKEAERMKKLQE